MLQDIRHVLAPCGIPLLSLCCSLQTTGDLLRLTYTLRTPRGPGGSLATYQGQTPTRLLGKLCYSAYVSVDRAWRSKNKAYPRVSTSNMDSHWQHRDNDNAFRVTISPSQLAA
jgi:hypothetical protein